MNKSGFLNSVLTSTGEFFAALKNSHTYNPAANSYFWFGFLWGLPIPFIALEIHLYATDVPLSEHSINQLVSTHALYWIFAIHPLIFAIVFGALGTIKKSKDTKINDLITRLKVESTHDSLTQLYNRAFFEFVLQQELTRAPRQHSTFSIVIFDIDNFKKINDHYGHLVGDRVLRTIGLLLKTNCRSYDTAARWGGEEFSLILPNTTGIDAAKIAERIRLEFSQIHHILAKEEFSCTLSAGIGCYSPGDNTTKLIDKADQALYLAKNNGRNCVKIFI